MNKFKIILNGIITENPTFVLLLGMCPTLGTTSSAFNGLGMGAATMFVLICSNIVISLIKNFIPDKVRIPSFIVVIAAFVTILQMCMEAYVPALYESLYRSGTSRSLCRQKQRFRLDARRLGNRLGIYYRPHIAG